MRKVNSYYKIEKPYRITLLESDIPVAFKSQALKKINTLAQAGTNRWLGPSNL